MALSTLTAGLAAAALLGHLHHQWLLFGLTMEAELFYVAGVRWSARYLRALAIPLFGLALLHLSAEETTTLPVRAWAPVAALIGLVFYANRALRPADRFYGYAGAGMAAWIGGYAAPAREAGRVWFPLAAAPFVIGWWRRLPDFRYQAYALAALAAVGTAVTFPHPPLSIAIAAAVSYGLAMCALWSPEDRFPATERSALFNIASTAGAVAVALLLRAELLPAATGPAWAVEALALAAVALVLGKRALEWQGCAAIAAVIHCWAVNLYGGDTLLAAAAAVGCFYAAQLLTPRGRDARLFYSLLGTALLSGLLYYQISGSVLTVAWGVEGLALLGAGFPLRDRVFRLSGLTLLLACILKLFFYDLSYLETLPRIFSFIVLGLILIGVSWIYTRFKERLQRYL